MLNMDLVDNTIRELENGDTNFTACDRLASLYIIRQYFNKFIESEEVNQPVDLNVRKELSDILPHYNIYCDKKRDYQLNKVGEEIVLASLKSVCQEISEFIHSLISSTDLQDERDIIQQMISNL